MKNLFKSIWNFLILKFKGNEKKTISKDEQSDIHRVATESQPERVHAPEKPKEQEVTFNSTEELSKYITPRFTKNDFRKLALTHGYEARYSGKEKYFYLHKINL